MTTAWVHAVMRLLDVNCKVPLQIDWLPTSLAIFSEIKLTSLATHCFVITLKLPR